MTKTQRKHKRIMRDRRKFKPDNIGKSYTVGTDDWESKFNKDINNKIKASEIEYKNYKDTKGKVIFLQQAGEKLFSAVENYLMLKYKTRKYNFKSIQQLVTGNLMDEELLNQAKSLHYFFYNGDLYMSRDDIERTYIIVLRKVKRLVIWLKHKENIRE